MMNITVTTATLLLFTMTLISAVHGWTINPISTVILPPPSSRYCSTINSSNNAIDVLVRRQRSQQQQQQQQRQSRLFVLSASSTSSSTDTSTTDVDCDQQQQQQDGDGEYDYDKCIIDEDILLSNCAELESFISSATASKTGITTTTITTTTTATTATMNIPNNNNDNAKSSSCFSRSTTRGLSSTVKGLIMSAVLFFTLSTAQIVFAVIGNSLALRADAGAMYADVVVYVIAIYCESIPESKARYKRIFTLVVSFLSTIILLSITIKFTYDGSIGISNRIAVHNSMDDASANGTVMIIFGVLNMLIDLSCLFYGVLLPRLRKKKMEQNNNNDTDNDDEDNGELNVNTMAAYAHVAADLIRSTATIIAAVIILLKAPFYQFADDVSSLVANVTIILGCTVGLWEWWCKLQHHHHVNKNDCLLLEEQQEKDATDNTDDSDNNFSDDDMYVTTKLQHKFTAFKE